MPTPFPYCKVALCFNKLLQHSKQYRLTSAVACFPPAVIAPVLSDGSETSISAESMTIPALKTSRRQDQASIST